MNLRQQTLGLTLLASCVRAWVNDPMQLPLRIAYGLQMSNPISLPKYEEHSMIHIFYFPPASLRVREHRCFNPSFLSLSFLLFFVAPIPSPALLSLLVPSSIAVFSGTVFLPRPPPSPCPIAHIPPPTYSPLALSVIAHTTAPPSPSPSPYPPSP